MADADILFLLTLGKLETQTLGGSVIWNFFHMIDIYKMAAIFKFFIISIISISVDTQKTGDPNLGGGSNLKFFCMIHIYKIVAIFQFFHKGWCWYSISTDTWKTRDTNFGGGSQ